MDSVFYAIGPMWKIITHTCPKVTCNLIQFLIQNSKIHNFHTVGPNTMKQSPCTPPCQELSNQTMNATKSCMVQKIHTLWWFKIQNNSKIYNLYSVGPNLFKQSPCTLLPQNFLTIPKAQLGDTQSKRFILYNNLRSKNNSKIYNFYIAGSNATK